MAAADRPVRVSVDGHEFDVVTPAGQPGQYDVAWISGPNPGYGFSSGSSDARPFDAAELEDAIRRFLAQVDPETGHIE